MILVIRAIVACLNHDKVEEEFKTVKIISASQMHQSREKITFILKAVYMLLFILTRRKYISIQYSNQSLQVIDGGTLLHRIRWVKKATYKACVEQYVWYIQERYVSSCIVFDGYGYVHQLKIMNTKEELEKHLTK